MEKRIREICRIWENGFWRIDHLGEDMISVVLKGRGSRKTAIIYVGKQIMGEVLTNGGKEGYIAIAEIIDNLPVKE